MDWQPYILTCMCNNSWPSGPQHECASGGNSILKLDTIEALPRVMYYRLCKSLSNEVWEHKYEICRNNSVSSWPEYELCAVTLLSVIKAECTQH